MKISVISDPIKRKGTRGIFFLLRIHENKSAVKDVNIRSYLTRLPCTMDKLKNIG